MRILVTGSEGTLGRPLCAALRKQGHDVWGADLMHALGGIRTDVRNGWQVHKTFVDTRPDVCFHLAAEFGRVNGQYWRDELWSTNCLGTSNVIDACVKHGVHLVMASSSEAYGDRADMGPLREDEFTTMTPHFHNEYALTKFTNEQQIGIAVRQRELKATILRFFNIYGPGERYTTYRSVICQFIYQAMHNLPVTVYADTTRSFLYIDDWCAAVTNVLHSLPCDTFNIASTEQVSMRTLWELVIQAVGGTRSAVTVHETEPCNVRDKIADSNKARDVLGLTERVPLIEGIKRTVAWMRRIDAEL